ncbi:Na+/H+ antiporter NhaC family protein [Alkaliphilus sp. MSJ-5]|uniref:Na+/H+ antiporter NhaC family protein n=1 Tax=Alkaliphilus flagellatus TaxID=2841507 RepID=A0ABS6G0I7_9FIRM|nr:Na+/H+ antiporter NhaC family protein [Alkaliphilus flagellatus]MBU5675133.1 Na+/H+ antiporter NhaC family protein [Alkaliphilus flagellatus]
MEKLNEKRGNGVALLPFLIFVLVYLISGIILQTKGIEMAFYQFPAPVAASIGIVFAFILTKGSLDEKFNVFIKGCGDDNIIIMCIIYLLAGAFSAVSSAMGGVESTVNLGLALIPAKFITVGIFIIAAFISISTGTSVGTIVAIGPIAVQLVEKAGLNLPLVLGALVGGAMFGDNLSIISDTTIAATRTQGVSMKDKFRANIGFTLPAALVTIVLLLIFGKPVAIPESQEYAFNIIKVIPYIFVLIAAIAGMNVFGVLTGGIIISGAIGLGYGSFKGLEFVQHIYSGFTGMFDIFLLSLLTGGLANMVSNGGGLDWLLYRINKTVKGKKSAELGISALVSLTDAATANNTVSIIVSGQLAKEISKEHNIDPRKTASLLDAFSCVMQGLIPYGAQLLIAGSFTDGLVSPVQIVPYVWYCYILVIFAILSIVTPFGNGYLAKNPWNFVNNKPVKEV